MTVDNSKVIGIMIKCMEEVNSVGLKEKCMKGNILKIKNKEKGSFTMEMVHFMMENGTKVDNTEEANFETNLANNMKEDTSMENPSNETSK